jgi:hypothetical protein
MKRGENEKIMQRKNNNIQQENNTGKQGIKQQEEKQ